MFRYVCAIFRENKMPVLKTSFNCLNMIYFQGLFSRLADWCNLKFIVLEALTIALLCKTYTDFSETWKFMKYIYIHKVLLLANLSQLNLLHFLTPYLMYIKVEGYLSFMPILSRCLFTQVCHRSPEPTTNEFLALLLCNIPPPVYFLWFNELVASKVIIVPFLNICK